MAAIAEKLQPPWSRQSQPSTRQELCVIAALALLAPACAQAAKSQNRCDDVMKALGKQVVNATCVEKEDLTTNGDLTDAHPTTPPDNSLPGLPLFSFVPRTDRDVLINAAVIPAQDKTRITKTVPGLQVSGWIAGDAAGEARFLMRLPEDWNGRLVVAGTPAQRSEYSSDYGWSDYVLQKGYAYASQNKGIYNFYVTTNGDPLGCRLNPASTAHVHFYDDDSGKPFTQWASYMSQAAELAREAIKGAYGDTPGNGGPRFTYAVGTSNGGYQVRRALESAPKLFDGGVDWEGTYVQRAAPNLLTDLPPAVLNYPEYVASGFSQNGSAARNIRAAGYPPDIVIGADSMWGRYYASYWEVTMCQWQKRLDPTYKTYGPDGSGLATYNYVARLSVSDVGRQMNDFATTGEIQAPLITVAGTMDALLPIDHHARAYQRAVSAALNPGKGPPDRKQPEYRLYEVQNGNHIENYKTFYPKLEYILPHAQHAFDLLVDYVEHNAALPPDQCIPRGGAISATPVQPGHCVHLFEP